MPPEDLTAHVKNLALAAGFERCGIAAAAPIGRSDDLRRWLDAGHAGSMDYLHRNFNIRADPRELLPGARSVIMVALQYKQTPPAPPPGDGRPRGRVAMYAWGDDYHDVIRAKLWGIVDRLRSDVTQSFDVRVCVDTAPLVERELAARAGIGWIGKNTMVLNAGLGSYFFLGAIVTTLALTPDDPLPDHCGSCTACLEACPTAAFPAAYQMDASRCISYLTIEHRESISLGFQEKMVNWVFGCDVCQEVCPFNRDAPHTQEPRFAIRPPGPAPVLDDILRWSAEDYRRELRGSAVKRAKPDMLRRNARIAKKNALKD